MLHALSPREALKAMQGEVPGLGLDTVLRSLKLLRWNSPVKGP